MTEQQWAEVNRIFDAAVALPPDERERYASTAAAGDTTVESALHELLRADSDAVSYIETPAAVLLGLDGPAQGDAAPLLAPGQLLCDRFRITRLAGAGGMGQVYEAFDEELGVRIAIKIIRPEFTRDPSAVRRFRHEVRLARSITHVNVCRTFDLERVTLPGRAGAGEQHLLFLTMEFLQGDTLAQHLARTGPLRAEQVLPIARQIAAALDAAHATGIVHRDIKPQNVVLVPSESSTSPTLRAVVTDFGLARAEPASSLAAHSRSGHSGAPAGTFAYMAPEQMEGRPVSAATDIFAFGLVLYEMLTGQRALSPSGLLSELGQRVQGAPGHQSPANGIPTVATIPEAWRAPLARCLALRPEDRFQSAHAVIAAFEAADQPPSRPRPRLTKLSPRWLSASAAALLLGVSLWLGWSRFNQTAAPGSVAAGSLIYVPPVQNHTTMSNLGNVTELMRTALTQSSHLNVLEESRVADVLERMARSPDAPIDEATAREIAMREGASRVAFISLRETGGLLHLDVDLQQTDNTPRHPREDWRRSWSCCSKIEAASDAIPPDLLHIIRDGSDWIRKMNGEATADIVSLDAPVEEVTTMNWDALAEFEKAERLAQQDRRADALVALRNAINRDPEFALAYARMGDILFSLDRGAEGLDAYRHALDAGDQRRLTRRERDRLRGLYAIDTWDYAEAENIFRDSTVYYPHDFLSWFYRGSALLMLDRLPEASDVLRHAETILPGAPSAPFTRGSVLFELGNSSGALAEAALLRQTNHVPEALWLEAEDAYLGGDFDKADRALTAIAQSGPSSFRSPSFAQRARLAMDRGEVAQAVAVLNQGIASDRTDGGAAGVASKQMDLAYIECGQAKYRECLADERASLQPNTDLRNLRLAADVLGNGLRHSPSAVALQLRAESQSLLKRVPDASLGNAAEIIRAQLQADVFLSERRTEAAAEQFRKVATLDAPAESPLHLAQHLTWVAEKEADSTQRMRLLDEALPALQTAGRGKAFLWYNSTWMTPGLPSELAADAQWVERMQSAAQPGHEANTRSAAHP